MRYRAALILLLTVSCSWSCQPGWVQTTEGVCQEVGESVKPSDELPPRGKNNPWEANGIHVVDLKPINPADEHHPKDCPVNCVWDGGTCDCKSDSGKEAKK
jgi:hypothetical protein